jgi:Fe-S-cluster containining protein
MKLQTSHRDWTRGGLEGFKLSIGWNYTRPRHRLVESDEDACVGWAYSPTVDRASSRKHGGRVRPRYMNPPMENELREAVLAASVRTEVCEAVDEVYAELAAAIEIRNPICKTSGRCCRFEEFGHRLYVSTMELAKFVGDLSLAEVLPSPGTPGEGQGEGLVPQCGDKRPSPQPSPGVPGEGVRRPHALTMDSAKEKRITLPIVTTGNGPRTTDHGQTVKPGCPYQLQGLCSVHQIRPFGCRIFFCDETSTAWQHEQYERLHGRLRQMHDQLAVPYYYVEWRFALKALECGKPA